MKLRLEQNFKNPDKSKVFFGSKEVSNIRISKIYCHAGSKIALAYIDFSESDLKNNFKKTEEVEDDSK